MKDQDKMKDRADPSVSIPRNFYFLSGDQLRFFEALCDTIVPAGQDQSVEPGALTVGALSYIDSSLFDLPKEAQEYFKKAIMLVDEKSTKIYSRKFESLEPSEKDSVLRDFYLDPKTREMMFDLRSIVLEGFYSDYHDPSYNGITAWEFVGFGGKRISDLKKDWSFLKVWKERQS